MLKGLDDLAEHLRSSGPASLRSSSTDAETASAEQAWEQLAHLNQASNHSMPLAWLQEMNALDCTSSWRFEANQARRKEL